MFIIYYTMSKLERNDLTTRPGNIDTPKRNFFMIHRNLISVTHDVNMFADR